MTPHMVLALDVGDKRIGLALASYEARLPRAYRTIAADREHLEMIKQIIAEEQVGLVVVGLPRGMEGQDTQQTHAVRSFGNSLAREISIPVHFQDETLTSVVAEEYLDGRKQPIAKGDIDAEAAAIILEDFIAEHAELLV